MEELPSGDEAEEDIWDERGGATGSFVLLDVFADKWVVEPRLFHARIARDHD